MVFLYLRRDLPLLRVRSLSLSFAAVIMLHLYWLAVQLGYVYGALMPAAVEYWIMSIYLPFGIALFQASNTQLLYVSKAQKRFARHDSMSTVRSRPETEKPSLRSIHRKLDYPTRMLLYVSLGMLFQLFLTTVMFLITRKFHPEFGVPGTEVTGTPPSKGRRVQGLGVVALGVLADLTMACCLAGLHASPMWLIALYVPGMAPVNQYFIPPQWIAVSVMVLEIFTILYPCYQTMRHQSLQQETLDSIARWESRNKAKNDDSVSDSWKSLAGVGKASSAFSTSDSVLVIGALEYVLDKNPEPLRQFSALKDFSGENIAFLMSVAEWNKTTAIARELARDKFNHALRIYNEYINPKGAEFPINIASSELRKLNDIFEAAARVMFGSRQVVADPVCPFDTIETSSASELTAVGSGSSVRSGDKKARTSSCADGSIKYLVLTNTWPKFVKERRTSVDSNRSDETYC
ncbi:unnamed protein product [Parascedosporium putredinis]|uniref:RGS domain-containing protein n=1 Tax=Parascedosporium putredinis TaxID=1442378 RepID=A0A9P1M877_9PEZI|nr:unnamed protein product [Parascedosporium putredinis]CAI7993092.1 unnamed protein product [Parascedosporium putredinis]